LSDDDREQIESASRLMASNALRVLAFAYKELTELPVPVTSDTVENGLVFIGFVGMIDPARPEVRDAVKVCREAGIRPVMITGDHIATAKAIAKDLGILSSGDIAIEGKELERMSDSELLLNIEKCSVLCSCFTRTQSQDCASMEAFRQNYGNDWRWR